MKRLFPSILVTLLLAVGGLWNHAVTATAASAPALRVATLSTVLADVARGVGGDRVKVVEIVKPDVDPHAFQPTPGDVQQVAGADVVLVSGKGLEGYLAKLEESAGGNGGNKQGGKFVDVGGQLGVSFRIQEEGRTVEDPHWWHSVTNVRRATEIVRDAFTRADAADADAFRRNAAAYTAQLNALDAEIKLKVATLPRDRRKLVTSHDAFGYFARDYGFKIFPIEGVSTAEEPSAQQVAELLKAIRAQGVKAVFFESTQNPKVTAEITRETGAKIGGELYADGLAAEGEATTYAGMMRHNVNTIVDALK